MKKANLILALACLCCLTGCVHHYQAQVVPYFDPIKEFKTQSEVTLINGQPATADYTFLQNGPHSYTASLNACTDTAIQTAQRELGKRGARIGNGFAKTITLSIDGIKIEIGWVEIDTTVKMHAKTSSGYETDYYGKDNAVMAGNIQNQLDGAVSKVVTDMLKDPKMIEFLNN